MVVSLQLCHTSMQLQWFASVGAGKYMAFHLQSVQYVNGCSKRWSIFASKGSSDKTLTLFKPLQQNETPQEEDNVF